MPLGPSNATVFDECHPCTRNHPGRCCLAPERPNPSSRAMYVNGCCITTRLHGTDERVPSGVRTSRRTLASKVTPALNKVQVHYGSTSSCSYETGCVCLLHEAHSRRHAPAGKCSPPFFKEYPSLAPPGWMAFSCFMGEMADCSFTRQHPSGQLTAGRYPPVSVDVAL